MIPEVNARCRKVHGGQPPRSSSTNNAEASTKAESVIETV